MEDKYEAGIFSGGFWLIKMECSVVVFNEKRICHNLAVRQINGYAQQEEAKRFHHIGNFCTTAYLRANEAFHKQAIITASYTLPLCVEYSRRIPFILMYYLGEHNDYAG